MRNFLFIALALYASRSFGQIGEIGRHIKAAIQARTLPGAVVLLSKDGQVLAEKAYGRKDHHLPNKTGTIYDLASLTKVVATTTSVMILAERGELSLEDRLADHFPQFKGAGKEKVTLELLLRHKAGLPPGVSPKAGEALEAYLERALARPLQYAPGTQTVYSDLGFILLGELVKKVSGQTLAAFAAENIYRPLKMKSTFYLVPEDLKAFCAPTLRNRRCIPHDPTAYHFRGHNLGHAGLFSTAGDLGRFAQMYLNKGQYEGVRVLSEETVDQMLDLQGNELRGLGWDFLSPYADAPRGHVFPKGISFGHTGYTGTMIWIDPASKGFVIFLANRVLLGDQNGKAFTQLRRDVSTAAAKAIYSR